MSFRAVLALVVLTTVFTSCKRKKQQLDCTSALLTYKEGVVNEKMSEQLANFQDLTIRTKGHFTSSSMDQDFSLLIKMKRDSFVWISATYMIEAARVFLTPDSFTLLDRLQRKYYTGSISDFKKYTGQDLSLRQIQDLIIGNPVYSASTFQIKNDDLRNDHLQSITGGIINRLHLNGCYRPVKSSFKANGSPNELLIEYSAMEAVKDVGQVPNNLNVTASTGKSQSNLILAHTSISSEPITAISFVIPSKYAKGH